MRPRHYCRGRLSRASAFRALLARFNEAAALLPRKARCSRWRVPRRRCFNEAAALLPRKALHPFLVAEELRGFNEAAALLPRKALGAGAVRLLVIDASMRPRHYCRGRRSTRSRQSQHNNASMRPRHYCRGRLMTETDLPIAGVLILLQ